MTDLLDRLVTRVLETHAFVQPRIAGLYEPVRLEGPQEIWVEEVVARPDPTPVRRAAPPAAKAMEMTAAAAAASGTQPPGAPGVDRHRETRGSAIPRERPEITEPTLRPARDDPGSAAPARSSDSPAFTPASDPPTISIRRALSSSSEPNTTPGSQVETRPHAPTWAEDRPSSAEPEAARLEAIPPDAPLGAMAVNLSIRRLGTEARGPRRARVGTEDRPVDSRPAEESPPQPITMGSRREAAGAPASASSPARPNDPSTAPSPLSAPGERPVRITIGRLEVRANPPRPVEGGQPRPMPFPSLDDYLDRWIRGA